MTITMKWHMILVALTLMTSCGMNSHGMNTQDNTIIPTPNVLATPVAYIRNMGIIEPWARSASTGENSASYLIINNGGTADTLVGVSSDIATSLELHLVENVDGVMQMKPVDGGIAIAENSVQMLQPSGYHIMMIGLTRSLVAGNSFDLTLKFANAGDVTVKVTIRR